MDKSKITKFNIRVYGLYVNQAKEILISDEEYNGIRMTKFPGGGLHFGEGPVDCLKREAMEEFGQEIEVLEHFYTTDFFQKALFYENQQLISIYYRAKFIDEIQFRIAQKPFDFKNMTDEIISFRFEPLVNLKPENLSFPIDQYVCKLLQKTYSNDEKI